MNKCNVCEETWFSDDHETCPYCGSDDYTNLHPVKVNDDYFETYRQETRLV